MEQEIEYTRHTIIKLVMDNAELERRNYILKNRIEIMENERVALLKQVQQLKEQIKKEL